MPLFRLFQNMFGVYETFEKLKSILIEPSVLAHFISKIGCELRTDVNVSRDGLGVFC